MTHIHSVVNLSVECFPVNGGFRSRFCWTHPACRRRQLTPGRQTGPQTSRTAEPVASSLAGLSSDNMWGRGCGGKSPANSNMRTSMVMPLLKSGNTVQANAWKLAWSSSPSYISALPTLTFPAQRSPTNDIALFGKNYNNEAHMLNKNRRPNQK